MNNNIKNHTETIEEERAKQQKVTDQLRQLWQLPPFDNVNDPSPVVNSSPVPTEPIANSSVPTEPVANSSVPTEPVANLIPAIPLSPRNGPPVKSRRRRLNTKTPQNNTTRKNPPWKSSVRGAANLVAANPFALKKPTRKKN
jgi:hypothetical protein